MKKQQIISLFIGLMFLFGLLSVYQVGYGSSSNIPSTSAGTSVTGSHYPLIHFDSISPNSGRVGEPVTVAVSVSPNANVVPTGTVHIAGVGGINNLDTTSCTITLVSGRGSCQLIFPKAGLYNIAASYHGDSYYRYSDAEYLYLVSDPSIPSPTHNTLTRLIISQSPDPSRPGQRVDFTVRVVPADSNCQVTIHGTGDFGCNINLRRGQESCEDDFLFLGSEYIWASLLCGETLNNQTYTGIQTSILHHVNYQADFHLSSSPNSPVVGQPVQLTLLVSLWFGKSSVGWAPIAEGIVSMSNDDQNSCSHIPLVNGSATCQFIFNKAGAQTIHAEYTPEDSNGMFRAGGADLTVDVVKPAPVYQPEANSGGGDGGGGDSGGGGEGCIWHDEVIGDYCKIPCPNPGHGLDPCP
jgi:hypothetical protein